MRFIKKIIISLFIFFIPLAYAESNQNDTPVRFLSLADIHFDPFIACHKTPCPLIQKLRAADVNDWANIFTQFDNESAIYREDTNYHLLRSALNSAKNEADRAHAAFVFVLGDFLGHEYRSKYVKYSRDKSRSGYREFVKKTMQFLINELGQTFPNIDVYSVIGNNDSYQEDYFVEPHGQYLQDVAKQFASLVHDQKNHAAILQSLPEAGYYAVDLTPTMRLVVLNSVLFSTNARGVHVEQTAKQELHWLHHQLETAKENHQHVLIAMHIPVGVDIYATSKIRLFTLIELWQTKYTKQFQAELTQFAPQITAVFSGHLHTDWFQEQTYNGSDIPMTGTPAISPIFGNNPGFKIYSYSPSTLQLGNFMTYYYPLSAEHAH